MFNKNYPIASIIILLLVSSCSQSVKTESSKTDTALDVEQNEFSIEFWQNEFLLKGDSSITCNISVSIGDDITFENSLNGNQTVSYMELLKLKPDLYNNIAYHVATNKGKIKIGLSIPNVCDTIINYRYDVAKTYELSGNAIAGTCAPLHGTYSKTNVETDIIKWLYRNGYNNMADSVINDIRLYIQDLNRSEFKQYQTKDEIPVVASLKDINYKINSDMKADYYYLFACQDEKQIDDFVEEIVSLKFEGAENCLNNPLSCYRHPSTNGLACIMLIGINSNWSYQIAPIGLISIDNVNPGIGYEHNRDNGYSSSKFLFKNHQIEVTTKSAIPNITGYLDINFGKFQGHGYILNVPFTFTYSGDINKILVHATSNYTTEIDLSDKRSPYHCTLGIGLNTGDNYIPIEAIDKRGNKSSYDLKITTERIKDNPVVENNIYY